MEKIFFDPYIIPQAVSAAEERGVKCKVFQIRCSLSVLLERDRTRPGIKEGCRKPLGDEVITKIYNQLEDAYYPGATSLDTEYLSIEECVKTVRNEVA